jgi:hypothetical protein
MTIASGGETLLEISMGADLTISDLNFDCGGGFDVFNQDGGKGIYVDIPLTRTGVVSLNLSNVTVSGVGDHGVHVSDCDLAICGAGSDGGGDGSAASIYAALTNVTIDDLGYGGFDADGLRIDDRGEGDITLVAVGSTFSNLGADGVELDEGNNGNVIVDMRYSDVTANGGYCAPIDLYGFPETDDPAPAPAHDATADDRCIEWDETEYVLDLDDGFDIDEAGNGNIIVFMDSVMVDDNVDEGLDFDEEGQGNVNLELSSVAAANNGDETIKVDEENGGNINARLENVDVSGGGDDGIQLEAADAGQLHAQLHVNRRKAAPGCGFFYGEG